MRVAALVDQNGHPIEDHRNVNLLIDDLEEGHHRLQNATGWGSRNRLRAAGGGHRAGLWRCLGRAAAERGFAGAGRGGADGQRRADSKITVREVAGGAVAVYGVLFIM